MQFFRLILISTVALAVSACGNLQLIPGAPPPEQLAGRSVLISGPSLLVEDVAVRPAAIGDQGMHLVQTKGGSLALGLLLGPLSAGANQANIRSAQEKLVGSTNLSGILKLKPSEELATALKGSPSELNPVSGEAVTISPYTILYVDDDRKNIYSLVGLRAETILPSSKKWVGHYVFVTSKMLSANYLNSSMPDAEFLTYQAEVQRAFLQLRNEIQIDMSRPVLKKTIQIASIKGEPIRAFQGFPYIGGDAEVGPGDRLALRVNKERYGDKIAPYLVLVFPDKTHYSFDLGPEPRQSKR